MKKGKLFLTALLVLATVFSVSTTSLAASTRNVTIGGNGNTSTVMTVKTRKKTTLKFTQRKGKISYQNKAMGMSTLETYGDFFVYVVDQSGKERPRNIVCTFKQSASISLSANKTYRITISPQAKSTTFRNLVNTGKLWYRAPWETSFTWKKVPTWTISINQVLSTNVNKVVRAPQQ